jgi:hypothetical protein
MHASFHAGRAIDVIIFYSDHVKLKAPRRNLFLEGATCPGSPPIAPLNAPQLPREKRLENPQLNSELPGCLYRFAGSERNHHYMLSPKFKPRRGSLHCGLTLAREIVTISEITALK